MKDWEKNNHAVTNEILNAISAALKNYKGGGKQLGLDMARNIMKDKEVSGHVLKKTKNIFKGSNEIAKQLLGGQQMEKWCSRLLTQYRDANENRNDLKDTAGINNSYRKTHFKESLIVFIPIIKEKI